LPLFHSCSLCCSRSPSAGLPPWLVRWSWHCLPAMSRLSHLLRRLFVDSPLNQCLSSLMPPAQSSWPRFSSSLPRHHCSSLRRCSLSPVRCVRSGLAPITPCSSLILEKSKLITPTFFLPRCTN